MPRVVLTEAQITRIALGQAVGCNYLTAPLPANATPGGDEEFALVNAAGDLLALGRLSTDAQAIKPAKVFISR